MENLTTTLENFTKVKSELDGLVFHKEKDGIVEIKFINCYIKYITPKTLNFLTT